MRLLSLFIPAFLLAGCTPLTFSNDNEPFAEYEYGSYGPDAVYNLYPTQITFCGDGQGTVSTPINEEIGIDQEAPHTVNFEMNTEEVEAFQSIIEESDFFSLSEDLSNIDVMDGGYEYLTIYTEDKSKQVGGSNPNDETLATLTDYMLEMLPDGVLRGFNEDIKNYQREMDIREY